MGWRQTTRRDASRSGLVLLEIVLSVGLFAGASVVVLSSLASCWRTLESSRLSAKAADLAVTKLSELQMDPTLLRAEGAVEYEDPLLAGWTWEVAVTPGEALDLQAPAMQRVEIAIRYDEAGREHRLVSLLPVETLEPEPFDEYGVGY